MRIAERGLNARLYSAAALHGGYDGRWGTTSNSEPAGGDLRRGLVHKYWICAEVVGSNYSLVLAGDPLFGEACLPRMREDFG